MAVTAGYANRTPMLHMPGHSAHTYASQTTRRQWRSNESGLVLSTYEWTALERKVNDLIELCAVLARENRALRAQQQNWTTERAKLIEKNELAKSRVESMITRLKALEQD
jgi:cell division protein ZapB